ncbi:OLC1v1013539C1 [Oldenlandia corymbosa var. corymbosa]|uniref:OLC1v1013539C1 n=1 Tax=Oldenlandia corymbosa var. corymbosa TaxID=529605 RepID=A0AAV1DYL6_OLDCO|nr:OLC1v1013539C1 [Oldenlandia corymbosa var. corymbosa]
MTSFVSLSSPRNVYSYIAVVLLLGLMHFGICFGSNRNEKLFDKHAILSPLKRVTLELERSKMSAYESVGLSADKKPIPPSGYSPGMKSHKLIITSSDVPKTKLSPSSSGPSPDEGHFPISTESVTSINSFRH